MAGILGDLAQGYPKNIFGHLKSAGTSGSGLDTFILLEERPDIRIKVEVTLTNLFNRNISIEWDSGNILPKATSGRTGEAYRLDREECHGIRELLVLLTHLYNDQYDYLIIDEPELNLHPQYKSFFMQEARLPAKEPVDTDAVLCGYLADYIHSLQRARAPTHLAWELAQLNAYFAASNSSLAKLFEITEFKRQGQNQFLATVRIREPGRRIVRVSHLTNAGMREFRLEEEMGEAQPS